MDTIRVAFCGQKNLYLSKTNYKKLIKRLEDELIYFLERTIESDVTFYFGGNGGFDAKAFAVLDGLKDIYDFEMILISPFPVRRWEDEQGYDAALCPFLQAHRGKPALYRRNEWLIDNCDVLFAFSPLKSVFDSYMLEYAKTHRQITGKPEIISISLN